VGCETDGEDGRRRKEERLMPPVTIGRVIALLVLIAVFVLALVGRMDVLVAAAIGFTDLAILVP
jgi:hypothetical protein